MFRSDYPRGLVNCLWLWGVPAFDPLPIAPALTVPFLLARRGGPVSLLRLPPRPFPRRRPAALAAIALARLPRRKTLLTPFEQTTPPPRPPDHTFPPTRLLIFGMACTTLGRAHGS